jgi:Siphovirus Gp157
VEYVKIRVVNKKEERMMSNSLYTLTNEFNEKVRELENYFSDDSGLDPEVFQDTMDSLTLPLEQKVENIVKYMRSLEALAEAKKAEAKRLSESASSDLKKAEWFKNYMADNLQKANISKLQAGVFALSFRKGSEVVEVDESKIPAYESAPWLYVKQAPKLIGKTELKKMLKDAPLPGVSIVRKPDSLVVK